MHSRDSRTAKAVRAWLAVAVLGTIPAITQAATTTWEMKGTITASQLAPSPDTPDIPVGTPFRLLVTFDTAASFTTRDSTDGRSGIRYQYSGTPSLKFALYAGSDCNPCEPDSIPSRNGIFVRDDFADPVRNPAPDVPYDGYSFFMDPHPDDGNYGWLVIFRDQAAAFSPHIINISGPTPRPLPVEPDPRLPQMISSHFEVFNSANSDFLQGKVESVAIPTYGTSFTLTGRDCTYPDFNSANVRDDCISSGRPGFFNRYLEQGGGPGQGDFSRTVNIEFPAYTSTPPAPLQALGTVFSSATFGGPAALPVVKASSYPTDIARTNGNVQAYQQYRYKGTVATRMPLVADLTYQISDNWMRPSNPSATTDRGLDPGVGILSATLAIVDGNLVPASGLAISGFSHRSCGSEAATDPFSGQLFNQLPDGSPWPAGAIMGTASYQSDVGEQGPQARLVKVVRCAASGESANADGTVANGEAVGLSPNQSFYVVTTMQTPARGRWQQTVNTTAPPAANGYSDAASTLRVTLDPQAPVEVLQLVTQSLEPTCTDCEFVPDERILRIDVKPGSADNAVQPDANGGVPVAIFGSVGLPVDWIDKASLRLGELRLRSNKAGNAQCGTSDVDLDGIQDLVCHFQNDAGNWQLGQTSVVLTGTLKNGEPLTASDSVRLVP